MKYQSAVLYEGSGQAQAVPLEAMEMRRRIVWLDEEITPEVANGVVRKISHLAAESDRPIVLAIDSPGGSVDAGLIICDAVSGCGAPVTTACVGRAYSMAAVVLSSGSRRLMTSSSKAMVHQPLIRQMPGGSSDDVEVLSGELREAKARLNSILKKNTGRSLREVERATKHDTFFTAAEAVKFGLADEVADLSVALAGEEVALWRI